MNDSLKDPQPDPVIPALSPELADRQNHPGTSAGDDPPALIPKVRLRKLRAIAHFFSPVALDRLAGILVDEPFATSPERRLYDAIRRRMSTSAQTELTALERTVPPTEFIDHLIARNLPNHVKLDNLSRLRTREPLGDTGFNLRFLEALRNGRLRDPQGLPYRKLRQISGLHELTHL